jgi:hypothetical protein
MTVPLDALQLEFIGQSYDGCLCHACLEDIADGFYAMGVNPKYLHPAQSFNGMHTESNHSAMSFNAMHTESPHSIPSINGMPAESVRSASSFNVAHGEIALLYADTIRDAHQMHPFTQTHTHYK